MFLDSGTIFAIFIALGGSCTVMVLTIKENVELRKYIRYLEGVENG